MSSTLLSDRIWLRLDTHIISSRPTWHNFWDSQRESREENSTAPTKTGKWSTAANTLPSGPICEDKTRQAYWPPASIDRSGQIYEGKGNGKSIAQESPESHSYQPLTQRHIIDTKCESKKLDESYSPRSDANLKFFCPGRVFSILLTPQKNPSRTSS